MLLEKTSQDFSGRASGKYFKIYVEIMNKNKITGTMLIKKGLEKYAEELGIDIDKIN